MNHDPYLLRLATRLGDGLSRMEPARKQRHRDFILSQQQPDGGFSGREGDSDLYYTGFAVRSLHLLGGLEKEERDKLGEYLKPFTHQKLNTIDLLSWLYSALVVQGAGGIDVLADADEDWPLTTFNRIESLRREDGGYAKSSEGASSSTYHSFLVSLIYELIGQEVPQPNRLVQFIYDRQRDDGGFVEIKPMKRSGTNPTAAAVALLVKYHNIDAELKTDLRDFLRDVCSSEGGFQANTRIPFSDGLSTFTGLLTSQDVGLDDILNLEQAEKFLTEWLEFPTGGFRGASWDESADVEYSFYGLGTLALIWSVN